jgi:hypothetical protein
MLKGARCRAFGGALVALVAGTVLNKRRSRLSAWLPELVLPDDLFHAMEARSLELVEKHQNMFENQSITLNSVISLRIHTACPLGINAAIC